MVKVGPEASTPSGDRPRVAVLGASGLIGGEIARRLAGECEVHAFARSFGGTVSAAWVVEIDLVALPEHDLHELLADIAPTLVVNCVGILQGDETDTHVGFVRRLVGALNALGIGAALVHVSIPGEGADDRTTFARTKREAEAIVGESGLAHVILRPGFVVAPGAYGGSALARSLAAFPLRLPRDDERRPFMAVAASDIAATVAHVARNGVPSNGAVWDLMHPEPLALGDVVDAHERWLRYKPPARRIRMPHWALNIGGRLADLAGHLGWRSPMRSTALAELRRGVEGDPTEWMRATGIEPLSIEAALAAHPATVADLWFARLYPLKAVAIVVLAAFWLISGGIALLVSYDEAREILLEAGLGTTLSHAVTCATGLVDIAVGALIAHRKTARAGLWAAVVVSVAYLGCATLLVPSLWLDPLGALVKTIPATALALLALAMLPDR